MSSKDVTQPEINEDASEGGATAGSFSDSQNSDSWSFKKENYSKQLKSWPHTGRHILAHYDESSIVVYQAYKASIAEFAVQNQRLGGPHFSFDRMSWIKTSFMWMMYRSGWAQKDHQEHVLAIQISRKGFDSILSKAYTMMKQKAARLETKDIEVRLQWDPDHDPHGEKLTRKAIQLGLKGKTLLDFATTYICAIHDITDYVHKQYQVLETRGVQDLETPLEQIYIPGDPKICELLDLDVQDNSKS
ncbi:uncharacterized protein LOC106060800 [Biomphalaria glabrata]|uniref:Uncharacterized protein LOC106060800 n=1 Tax=Biomphalaria glabrata TaxID=6526 RepID=A0A9W2YFY8_BIOGL|nr:uncharacterized protein LOC106060800 [Biomphalaria glabrata]XP_055861637.1 uncharacterized protein LOC106060800 [Biomphalaria glabrata]XP_055861639.1 uncharacterized protein LOC106060800 [Biomphalaria glabrata]